MKIKLVCILSAGREGARRVAYLLPPPLAFRSLSGLFFFPHPWVEHLLRGARTRSGLSRFFVEAA